MSSFNQKHNKYNSTPDWFKDSASITDDMTTSAGTGTGYGGSVIGSVSTTVDYNEIPIDNSTIVWQDEKLLVPIDNDTIVIKNGKLMASFEQSNVQGSYVTVNGDQDVNGLKNFKPGILIDGIEVTKQQDDVVYIGSNLVVRGGITMYADVGDIDVPNLYDGIPIDGETLFWEYDSNGNKVLKSKSGTIKKVSISGDGNALSSVYLAEEGTSLQFLKNYTFATVGELVTKVDKSYVDDNFVTLDTLQTIKGKKDFTTGGLFVNGNQIKYDQHNKYWKLEGDLIITGGITMYGNDSDFEPSTIMDGVLVDDITIKKNDSGKLEVIGSSSGDNSSNIKVVTSEPTSYEDNTLYVFI